MTDVLWPTNIIPSSQTWGVVDNVGVNQSPLSGSIRTVARTGARMKCTLTLPPLNGQDRARMMAFIAALRGRSNRAYVPDFSTTLRGSFPATELLTNNDFSNGTTGWTGGTAGTLAVTERVARVTRTAYAEMNIIPTGYSTVSQYAPLVARAMVSGFSIGAAGFGIYAADSGSVASGASYTPANPRMMVVSIIPSTTQAWAYIYDAYTGEIAGDFIESPYISLSRCALADAGANLLLQSDTFNTTWSTTNCTVSANAHTAPDGTVTADSLIESGATNVAHNFNQNITVSSAAQDVTFSVSVVSITRAWCAIRLIENTGSMQAYVFVNLATGAAGTTTASGANWSNVRAHVVSQGQGWYRITVTARKTNAATSLTCAIQSATADASFTYAGSAATDAICVWRACASPGSVPSRGSQTTSTAVASGTAQTGSGIYVKGLPVSTSGLLKAGDMVQMGNQINIVTAPLDSNASGLGYLQCGNPWRASIADNDPLIVKTPMAKMILASEDMSWETGPGQFSPFQLEFIEDVT